MTGNTIKEEMEKSKIESKQDTLSDRMHTRLSNIMKRTKKEA